MSTQAYVSRASHTPRLEAIPIRFKSVCLLLAVAILVVTSGCTSLQRWKQQRFKVGPDYCAPPAPVADTWIDYENPDVDCVPTDYSYWWSVFGDPTLDQLIQTASQQNLTLQATGMRIIEARARLGIAKGSLFPQRQQAYGDFARVNTSATLANALPVGDFDAWDTGFNASWELDFWGRFRRAIEVEDALLNAEIENYDNVLVVLQAEVATAYIQYRTLQRRLELAKKNVELQQTTARYADINFRNGLKSEIPLAFAKENLAATESLIPEFESGIRQTGNAICVLLGVPPRDLTAELGEGPIPEAPAQILVGIPAELLKRRPDVRRAERLAAAQSAAIGVAESDFYPRIAITGFIGLESQDLAKLFDEASLAGAVGPGFQWNILNYGRILNNVRANEAKFHQLVFDYQRTVLDASREVEDGIIALLKERDRVKKLDEAQGQIQRAVDISIAQRQAGGSDDQWRVYFEQLLTTRQDALAASRGAVAQNLVSIYKALGGGWQTRMMGAGTYLEAAPLEDAPLEDVAPTEAEEEDVPADQEQADVPAPPEEPQVP